MTITKKLRRLPVRVKKGGYHGKTDFSGGSKRRKIDDRENQTLVLQGIPFLRGSAREAVSRCFIGKQKRQDLQ
jgi:hypothetical protein